ncbi:pRiA4b ORF-3-like protein [Modestobacter sp. DSM 44400]|uniref:plasmid pRiA4b ORF-3 family protein n=1 Tax=Modestobacter sp. DSM 44400 TaxID=1550230 RepID=UPI000897BF5C|nr:plasmid pRiA4b ORF-3 family protein [Modestobacter sp. DSM 44400]SDY87144.1 pRiA4b ORF-3-like protein [Modestobacter sp. DSM 44400]
MKTTRLQVTLREVTPKVQRVIDVPAAITLDELHEVLQLALGWTDSHLHQYRTHSTVYSIPSDDAWADEGETDERGVRLSALPSGFTYLYDFGDGWTHDVEVLGPGGDAAGCVDGEGACPPEDCGGPCGYAELLAALADPRHPEHAEMREWVGDRLRPFDRTATDRRVRDVVGQVPASVCLLLGLLTGGVKLTPGGRLPRAVVRAVQEQRPDWYPLGRPASIEEDLLPLAALHVILRHVGLLRLANGVLHPTKAAGDEVETVRRLRAWFPPREFDTLVAERAVALVATRGPLKTQDLAAEIFAMLSHGWRRGNDPMTATDVQHDLYRLAHQLAGLDMLATYSPAWTAGPSDRSLLPGVPLLADLS